VSVAQVFAMSCHFVCAWGIFSVVVVVATSRLFCHRPWWRLWSRACIFLVAKHPFFPHDPRRVARVFVSTIAFFFAGGGQHGSSHDVPLADSLWSRLFVDPDNDGNSFFVCWICLKRVKKVTQKSRCCVKPHGNRRMGPPSLDPLFAAYIEG